MRWTLSLVLLVLLPPCAASQTSAELSARYGKPIREIFLVQPKIALTAVYSADGEVCQMVINPPPAGSNVENPPLMPTEAVSALIDELLPPSGRGEPVKRMITKAGCNAFGYTEYSAFIVERSQHNCDPASPDRDIQTQITFKQRAVRPLG